MRRNLRSTVLGVVLAIAGMAFARAPVTIGAIYPLTGSLAANGVNLKRAVQLAVDIVNNAHPELAGIPLAATEGLPNLGGAKLKVVFADSQGQPSVGESEARRLITQEHVAALIGAYQSSVSKTASRPAELQGVPFLTASSSSPSLTERGYKWYFRTGPTDDTFVADIFKFLDTIKSQPTKRVAVVYENTDFGTHTYDLVKSLSASSGRDLVAAISYTAGASSLSAQVQRLQAAKPDVAVFASYVSDALLFVKTMQQVGYAPPLLVANDAGFSTAQFEKEDGTVATGVISRSAWAADLGTSKPVAAKIDALFRKTFGVPLDGGSSRVLQGALVLADAINRAGSTKPAAIRQALLDTNLSSDQVFMPWGGVKFDAHQQNSLTRGVIVQLQGGTYHTIWPPNLASVTLELPFHWH